MKKLISTTATFLFLALTLSACVVYPGGGGYYRGGGYYGGDHDGGGWHGGGDHDGH